jgi:putative NIF3 family GTP cyclohydrolase 1 type 2
VLPRRLRGTVVSALLDAHPYEEPAFDLVELADPGRAVTGTGRVGTVAATTLGEFAETVATALPATAHGVRVAGDPARVVRRVALCGGAGDFLLDHVAGTGADVYVTSDLRHHRASEFLELTGMHGGPALVDVAHWAAEWTWLPVVRARLAEALGDTVGLRVSTTNTDPWSFRI